MAHPSMFPAFEYEPLPSPTSIRLLRRITARRGDTFFGCMAFELQTFDLDSDDYPAFEALSYTWGDPHPPGAPLYHRDSFSANEHWALLNGAATSLTPNLYKGLRQLTKRRFINTQGARGKTPLYVAAEKGDLKEVRALLHAGADVTIQASDENYKKYTPFLIAYKQGHTAVFKELTKHENLGRYLTGFEPMYDRQRSAEMDEYVKALCGQPPEYDGYWWVDAICINQQDAEERAAQVKLMARIYTAARHVPVWLGDMDNHYSRSVDALRKQSEEGSPPALLSREEMGDTAAFFKRTWFSRTWIIQEVVLARSVTFHMGGYEIPFEQLDRLLDNISRTSNYLPGETPGEIRAGLRAIQQGKNLRSLRNRFQSPYKGEFSLYAVLEQSGSYECTEPRDRIFALLSLIRNEDGEPEMPMQVSYTAPLHEVFTTATRQALMEAQNLAPLSWASAWFDGDDDVAAQLPSWVPAYHLFRAVRGPESSLEGLSRAFGSTDAPSLLTLKRPCFSASGRLRRDRNEQAFEGITPGFLPELEVNGLVFDRIAKVSKVTSGKSIRFQASWLDLVGRVGAQYPNGDSSAKALMLTAFTGKYNSSSVFKSTTSSSTWGKARVVWKDLIRDSLAADKSQATGRELLSVEQMKVIGDLDEADGEGFMVSMKDLIVRGPDVGSLDSPFRALLANDDERQILDDCLFNALDRRAMFITEKGYLGLGPAGTRTGDEVWILPASSVPFVFRKKEDGQYRHLGETYVHGIMSGEAVPDPKVKLKSIVLV